MFASLDVDHSANFDQLPAGWLDIDFVGHFRDREFKMQRKTGVVTWELRCCMRKIVVAGSHDSESHNV